jgi:SMI1 / KNR4 family (SUKH-1)
MSNLDIYKWLNLRTQHIEVVMGDYANRMELATLAEIKDFENHTHITLPREYKEFCLVFGHGIFGITHFDIECLPRYRVLGIQDRWSVAGRLEFNQTEILNFKRGCEWTSTIEKTFESALVFGEGDYKDKCFLFDLNSYSEEDLSCDIYGLFCSGVSGGSISHEHTGVSYFLGRSFFDFVKNICIGDRAQLECPKLLPEIEIYERERATKPDYYYRRTFIVFGGLFEELIDEELDEFDD